VTYYLHLIYPDKTMKFFNDHQGTKSDYQLKTLMDIKNKVIRIEHMDL